RPPENGLQREQVLGPVVHEQDVDGRPLFVLHDGSLRGSRWPGRGLQNLAATSSRLVSDTGFLMKPSLRSRSFWASSGHAETITAGSVASTSVARRAARNSLPFMTGIKRSTRMRHGVSILRRRSSPSYPLQAVTTAYPSSTRASQSDSRISWLSST